VAIGGAAVPHCLYASRPWMVYTCVCLQFRLHRLQDNTSLGMITQSWAEYFQIFGRNSQHDRLFLRIIIFRASWEHKPTRANTVTLWKYKLLFELFCMTYSQNFDLDIHWLYVTMIECRGLQVNAKISYMFLIDKSFKRVCSCFVHCHRWGKFSMSIKSSTELLVTENTINMWGRAYTDTNFWTRDLSDKSFVTLKADSKLYIAIFSLLLRLLFFVKQSLPSLFSYKISIQNTNSLHTK
jgi:hypothetical protein